MTLDTLFEFTSAGDGERLDKAICAAIPELSRTQAHRLIEDGHVTLDGAPVRKPAHRLERVVAIHITQPPPQPTHHLAENIPLDIVFENDDLIVINKPAGMVVHPAVGHATGTLVNAVLGHDPDLEGVGDEQRPGMVHRLDKDTSGLIVVAKNDLAHRELQRQFKEREIEKVYLALLDGHPPTPTGRIEAALGRDPRDRKKVALVAEAHGGRPAVTEYKVQKAFQFHTLIEVKLITGRTHQIRVHCAFLNCPIVGDRQYGRRRASLPLDRQFLHAASLTLTLPHSGERRTFSAPLPTELEQILATLR